MLQGYSQAESHLDGIVLFRQMHYRAAALPNRFTYALLVKSCAKTNVIIEGEQVHCVVAKHGFKLNTFMGTALIDIYYTRGSGSIVDAYKVFDEMRKKIEQHRWLLYWTDHLLCMANWGTADEYGSGITC
ncbi:hypothetical protein RJT34_16349 [Clitoria ternatea]|uniref:Pentatricopeptide repeat-containing protein n=1 Tax=Clitoria ternatea TaxID=43366 RepID=A0AAN9J787_CLITE